MPSTSKPLKALRQIQDLTNEQVQIIFSRAQQLKSGAIQPQQRSFSSLAALVFLEPSTRTRFSFDMAAKRMGVSVATFTADTSTSLVKGESLHETVMNILAMSPDLMVIRHSGDPQVQKLLAETQTPIINAGDGAGEHPTQALLDALTILERRGKIEGEKILFVGDVQHSRVARSGRALLQRLGAEVAVCAPKIFMPTTSDWDGVERFSSMSDGLKWCNVCIGLRMQVERHDGVRRDDKDLIKFRLDKENLRPLSEKSIIMHPGPFVNGVDLSEEILTDSRCAIYEQVKNGVYVRMALIGEILGISCS